MFDFDNVLIGKSIRQANLTEALKSQNKYVTQVNQQLAGTIEAAYEPMLESSIVKKVIAVVNVGEKTQFFKGILKEYTSEFIELMNVLIPINSNEGKMADMIFPRSQGMVRYLSE